MLLPVYMKMLLAILFGLSVTLNAPTVCAHALGATSKSMLHEAMMAGDSHHEMATHTQASQKQSHHDHHGDTSGRDDCKGGSDCDGCTMVVASMSDGTALYLPDAWHASTMPIATGLTGAPDAIEPPPPRG
ncbi:hypothetical protein FF098_009200 [Parvularcula flava]|uniref:Cobalt transporter n=1 Tax=Aquisalinus luteolus TaxID=1566827 RepID=A0A8J3A846_9PROT|nr:hypothetical protein [Aquisalinus luteolus]NHK28078.1 hypothetical protein [Aquisalinus luteolus]GGH97388.1 hypothetical protein GCM10011355_18510 [Aquisalinus luteolus]